MANDIKCAGKHITRTKEHGLLGRNKKGVGEVLPYSYRGRDGRALVIQAVEIMPLQKIIIGFAETKGGANGIRNPAAISGAVGHIILWNRLAGWIPRQVSGIKNNDATTRGGGTGWR